MEYGQSAAELRKLAELRLDEAEALLDAKMWSGARYLAGYALELGLKAKIAKRFRRSHLPDKSLVQSLYTHKLTSLVDSAELKPDLSSRVKTDSSFAANWGIASKWSEQDRYRTWQRADAESMVNAVRSQTDGIFPWIKTYW